MRIVALLYASGKRRGTLALWWEKVVDFFFSFRTETVLLLMWPRKHEHEEEVLKKKGRILTYINPCSKAIKEAKLLTKQPPPPQQ